MSQFDREVEDLEEQLEKRQITKQEYWRELHELQRAYSNNAREAAQRAYDDELERW